MHLESRSFSIHSDFKVKIQDAH